jgi:hypothetical protein
MEFLCRPNIDRLPIPSHRHHYSDTPEAYFAPEAATGFFLRGITAASSLTIPHEGCSEEEVIRSLDSEERGFAEKKGFGGNNVGRDRD